MSWGKFALVELGMHVEPFVGGLNPPIAKKAQFLYIYIYIYIIHVNKKYKFDKCTLINFKIYLIFKL